VCDSTLLSARVCQARSRGAADAGALRETQRQAEQERCCGCGGNLRGGDTPDDAIRGGKYAPLLHLIAEGEAERAPDSQVTAWLVPLMRRRAQKIAAVALGNKIARILWAMMVRDEPIALRSR
jgi:hypothetical protein